MNNSGSGNQLPRTPAQVVEELYGRYRQSNSQSVASTRQNSVGSDNHADRQDQFDGNGRTEETRRYNAGDTGIERSDAGDGYDSGQSDSSGRPTGANYGGTYQYNGGPATAPEYSVTESYPVRKSKFGWVNGFTQPYRNAIKESAKSSSKKKKEAPKAKVFSEAEAKQKRADLIETLLWQSEHIDQIIIATTRDHIKTLVIWGDLDRSEAAILADFLLSRARQDARTAAVVRGMLELQNKIKLGMIVGPRLYRTLAYYMEKGFSIR